MKRFAFLGMSVRLVLIFLFSVVSVIPAQASSINIENPLKLPHMDQLTSKFSLIQRLSANESSKAVSSQYDLKLLEDLDLQSNRNSYALGINDLGSVVGYADSAPEFCGASQCVYTHGVRFSSDTNYHPIDLKTLGGNISLATGSNVHDYVVGAAEESEGINHAFVRFNTSNLYDLGTLGGQNSLASAINNQSMVVGFAQNDAGQFEAVKWSLESLHTTTIFDNKQFGPKFLIEPLEKHSSEVHSIATDINDEGYIVGYGVDADIPNEANPVRWDPEGIRFELDVLSNNLAICQVHAINNNNVAVGACLDKEGVYKATKWQDNGKVSLVPVPDAKQWSIAYDINDDDTIVGAYGSGAFLSDPVDGAIDLGDVVDLDGTNCQSLDAARSINNEGEIVGNAQCSMRYKAFQLSPNTLP